MSGQQGADAPATASDSTNKPLQRIKTQLSDRSEDPPSPTDGTGEPLNLPQLAVASRLQLWWDSTMCQTLRLPLGYRKAGVLLIKWETELCDFGKTGEDEVNELKQTFESSFNFETTIVSLTHYHKRSPEVFLRDQVSRSIRRYSNPNDLLIVYYSGHADMDLKRQLLLLHPKRSDKPCPVGKHKPELNWNVVEEVLMDEAKGDVLVILDTCCAGNLRKAIAQRDLGIAYEFLSACEENKPTASPGPKSFTKTLNKCLVELAANGSFTTPELLSCIQKQEDRQHNPPAHWRRAPNTLRYIQLSRLPDDSERAVTTAEKTAQYFGEDVPRYLNLRIELKQHEAPTQTQIEALARSVSCAVKQSSDLTGLATRRIDWMGIASRTPKKNWRSAVKSITQQIRVTKCFQARSIESIPENPLTTLTEPPRPVEEQGMSGKRPRSAEPEEIADSPPAKRASPFYGIATIDFAADPAPISSTSDSHETSEP